MESVAGNTIIDNETEIFSQIRCFVGKNGIIKIDRIKQIKNGCFFKGWKAGNRPKILEIRSAFTMQSISQIRCMSVEFWPKYFLMITQ